MIQVINKKGELKIPNFSNEIYRQNEYVYGENPTAFFSEHLKKLSPATISLPFEGDWRDTIFTVSLRSNVLAFDNNEGGKPKAFQLTQRKEIHFDYQIANAANINYPKGCANSSRWYMLLYQSQSGKLCTKKL